LLQPFGLVVVTRERALHDRASAFVALQADGSGAPSEDEPAWPLGRERCVVLDQVRDVTTRSTESSGSGSERPLARMSSGVGPSMAGRTFQIEVAER
jgi:hypothetical protein